MLRGAYSLIASAVAIDIGNAIISAMTAMIAEPMSQPRNPNEGGKPRGAHLKVVSMRSP
jgi:hypothetical protein